MDPFYDLGSLRPSTSKGEVFAYVGRYQNLEDLKYYEVPSNVRG